MNRLVLIASVCCLVPLLSSAQKRLSEGAALLFKEVKSKTSAGEKEQIFNLTGFMISASKDRFTLGEGTKEYPFTANVYPVDINRDGNEEIFISWGNSFTSGITRASIALFIKNKEGAYMLNLGFPGLPPDILQEANLGFPDLVIGLPGFKFPVWRWNGTSYAYHRSISAEFLNTAEKTNAIALSQEYCGTTFIEPGSPNPPVSSGPGAP